MFLLNLGYKWIAHEVSTIDGVVIVASGNSSAKCERASLPDVKHILFDPQLYLAGLDASICKKVCGRLTTHPWFGVSDVPDFDSASMKRREWDAKIREHASTAWPRHAPEGDHVRIACEECIDFQLRLGCTQLILPSPLIQDREDEASIQALWLDQGLQAASDLEVGQPILATVAVAETALNEPAFEEGGFLDTIVDQVTARTSHDEAVLDGVYVVVAKSKQTHPFEASAHVYKAYQSLCQTFRVAGFRSVIAAFSDVFGLACVGGGASGLTAGPSQSLRQLALDTFVDEGFGAPLPHYYSHRLAGELRSEDDLDRIRDARLYRRVRDDTNYSRALSRTILAGGSASRLPDWAESKNNVTVAQLHFLARLSRAEQALQALTPAERADEVRDWLENAVATSEYVESRLNPDKVKGTLAPSDQWLKLYDSSFE